MGGGSTLSWHKVVVADLLSRNTILCAAVWVLRADGHGWDVVWVVGARSRVARHATLDQTVSTPHLFRVHAGDVSNERPCHGLRGQSGRNESLGEHRCRFTNAELGVKRAATNETVIQTRGAREPSNTFEARRRWQTY